MPIPCLTHPTPKELAAETKAAREATYGLRFPPRRPPPPPGAVRVEFYTHMSSIIQGLPPDIVADIELEMTEGPYKGGLDTWKLCEKWGLENALAIDPQRWTIQQRPAGKERYISAVAVHVLSNEYKRPIMFTEMPVSKHTARVRTLREIGLNLGNAFYLLLKLLLELSLDSSYTVMDTITPLPHWYRKLNFYYHNIDWVRYRHGVRYGCIGLKNDLNVKKGKWAQSSEAYVNEKRVEARECSEALRRRLRRNAVVLWDELVDFFESLLPLLKMMMWVVLLGMVLYFSWPWILEWETKWEQRRWESEREELLRWK